MNFDSGTGKLEISSSLQLWRLMKREDIFAMANDWENWSDRGGQVTSYRKILDVPELQVRRKILLYVTFSLDDGPINSWNIAPWNLIEGAQSRPEGQYTKAMRKWFLDAFASKLPIRKNWGDIDASYDYHNQTTTVFCGYRERFLTEEDWKEYRANYR